MKSFSHSFSLIFIALALTACGKPKPSKYLLPELNSEGQMQLSEVNIETLGDPQRVQGPAAVVYENPLYDPSGFHGKPAEPRLSQTETLWIPMDVQSSSALSIYYGFERIKKFEDRVIPAYSRNLVWPRKVAFDLQIIGGGMDNNAFYSGKEDVTVIMPYTKNGLPISFNAGVLAHEHFHAHFYKMGGEEVAKNLGAHFQTAEPHLHHAEMFSETSGARCGMKGVISVDPSRTEENVREITNFYIVRGWNEGLSDLYAALVTGNPDGLEPSLKVNGFRSVGESPLMIVNRSAIESMVRIDMGLKAPLVSKEIGFAQNECGSMEIAYLMGTQIARTLYMQLVKVRNSGKSTNILSPEDREWAVQQLFHLMTHMKEDFIFEALQGKVETDWISAQLLPVFSAPAAPQPISTPDAE